MDTVPSSTTLTTRDDTSTLITLDAGPATATSSASVSAHRLVSYARSEQHVTRTCCSGHRGFSAQTGCTTRLSWRTGPAQDLPAFLSELSFMRKSVGSPGRTNIVHDSNEFLPKLKARVRFSSPAPRTHPVSVLPLKHHRARPNFGGLKAN